MVYISPGNDKHYRRSRAINAMKCERRERRPDFGNDNVWSVLWLWNVYTDSVVKSKNDCHMMTLFYNIHYTIIYVLTCYELKNAV